MIDGSRINFALLTFASKRVFFALSLAIYVVSLL
jgi:hypothetical protein